MAHYLTQPEEVDCFFKEICNDEVDLSNFEGCNSEWKLNPRRDKLAQTTQDADTT